MNLSDRLDSILTPEALRLIRLVKTDAKRLDLPLYLMSGVVLSQATLTFINIRGDLAWGTMLANERDWIIGSSGSLLTYWWLFFLVTLVVMLFGIGWNMLGDGLSDMFDPRAL